VIKLNFSHSHSSSKNQSLAASSFDQVIKNNSLGFHQITQRKQIWESCTKLAQQWQGLYDQVAVIGIGGSSLGPQVIQDCFFKSEILFFENVDPVQFKNLAKKIKNPNRTAWVCSSKSGSTIETLCLLEALYQEFHDLGQMVAVVSEQESNLLTDWAKKNDHPILEISKDIGGRFSVLTPVGMLPAALIGLDLEKFRVGAETALKQNSVIEMISSQVLDSFDRKEWITVFWFYASSGVSMGRWVQQLWAESLGKQFSRQNTAANRASTPMFAMGSVDQHSTLQQMMDGEKDKFFWFFRFQDRESQFSMKPQIFSKLNLLKNKTMGDLLAAQALATEKALNEQKAHSLQIKYEKLDEASVGHFFMLMQLVVATVAEALNINAYDQPGVERGKILALEELQKS